MLAITVIILSRTKHDPIQFITQRKLWPAVWASSFLSTALFFFFCYALFYDAEMYRRYFDYPIVNTMVSVSGLNATRNFLLGDDTWQDGEHLFPSNLGPIGPALAQYIFKLHAELADAKDKIAVCLTGSTEALDITGPSIQRHLLGSFPTAAVFVAAHLDSGSWQLAIFNSPSPPPLEAKDAAQEATRKFLPVVAMSVTPPMLLNQSDGMPLDYKLLLLDLSLAANCAQKIRSEEANRGVMFRWVLHASLDGYWAAPPPDAASLQGNAFAVPVPPSSSVASWRARGSSFSAGGRKRTKRAEGGQAGEGCVLDDFGTRFGMGDRKSAMVALEREESLKLVIEEGWKLQQQQQQQQQQHQQGVEQQQQRWWTSPLLSATLASHSSSHQLHLSSANLSVCSVALRPLLPQSPAWHRQQQDGCADSAAASLLGQSERPLNGGPCRVCVAGKDADVAPPTCSGTEEWSPDWQHEFNRRAPREFVEQRQQLLAIGFRRCLREAEKLRKSVGVWHGPSARSICLRRHLGQQHVLGEGSESFLVFTKGLTQMSTVYCVSSSPSSPNSSWLSALRDHAPLISVHLISGTPPGTGNEASLEGVGELSDGYFWQRNFSASSLELSDGGGWPTQAKLTRWAKSVMNRKGSDLEVAVVSPYKKSKETKRVPSGKSVNSFLRRMQHKRIDIMNVNLQDGSILPLAWWTGSRRGTLICQLLVSLPDAHRWRSDSPAWEGILKLLSRKNFDLVGCHHSHGSDAMNCSFFSLKNCVRLGATLS